MMEAQDMEQTIDFCGVEIPDFGDRHYRYAVVEVTRHCNLRCETCFFFQAFQHPHKNIPDDELLQTLRALQERHRIKLVTWVGGEPLLRPALMEQVVEIFDMNVIFTNGTLPIPALSAGIGVSLDGPPEINDHIRGAGVYEKVKQNLDAAPQKVFIQSVVTKTNALTLERFVEGLTHMPNVFGVVFSIYVPQKNDTSGLAFTLEERDQLLDTMIRLKDRFDHFIINERRALELTHSSTANAITSQCDMKENALALDYRLRRRLPCCYGENVDCDLCAAPTPFAQAARQEARRSPITATEGSCRTELAEIISTHRRSPSRANLG